MPTASALPRRPVLVFAVLLFAIARSGIAQGSTYIPLDDPFLPLLEQLIARGDVQDPSPQVRPLNRADAIASLRLAARAARGRTTATRLLERWDQGRPGDTWELDGRVGVQAYTSARRDLLYPIAGDFVEGTGEVGGRGTFGVAAGALRVRGENRLKRDLDWEATDALQSSSLAYRVVEGYVSGAWRGAQLHYGQVDRNWGPAGTSGLGVSDNAYARPDLAANLRWGRVSAWFVVAALDPLADSAGVYHARATAAHRIAFRTSSTLTVALWEASVLAAGDSPFGHAVAGLAFPFGLIDDANVIAGADVTWRPMPSLGLDVQVMLDNVPDRALGSPVDRQTISWTIGAEGPVAAAASWRARWSRVSRDAYAAAPRLGAPLDDFIDARVGTVRVFPDNDRIVLSVALPLRSSWLVEPDLSVLRQGAGQLGTVRTTWRAGLAFRGAEGPIAIDAAGGLHHTRNADHVVGRSSTRFEARVRVTAGLLLRGGT